MIFTDLLLAYHTKSTVCILYNGNKAKNNGVHRNKLNVDLNWYKQNYVHRNKVKCWNLLEMGESEEKVCVPAFAGTWDWCGIICVLVFTCRERNLSWFVQSKTEILLAIFISALVNLQIAISAMYHYYYSLAIILLNLFV